MRFLSWIGYLPLWVLYLLSDFVYFLLYYVVGYRKKLVFKHLKHAFPEKSQQEIKQIAKKFYQHLADIFVETLKLPHLSVAEIQQRVEVQNIELLQGFITKNQPFLSFGAHMANWEWIPAGLTTRGIPVDAVYKTLTNEKSDKFMQSLRASFGVHLIPMPRLMREIVTRKHLPRLIGLVADQSPHSPEHAHWFSFLHQDTAFFPGTEKIARATEMPIVFADIYRKRRGYYAVSFQLISLPPYQSLSEGSITEMYKKKLEESIKKHPADWLWSHNRWKHKRK